MDLAVPALVAATVFSFASGSSSVADVKNAAHDARWLVLVLLGGAAALWWGGRTRLDGTPARAAAAFVVLALVSAAWSVAPRESLGRGASLAVLLATVAILSAGAAAEQGAAEHVIGGVLAGAAAVGLAGLVVLGVSYGTAVESATIEAPARFRGFGEDPNTASLLFAVVTPLALAALSAARGRVARAAVAGALLLFAASIVASGSHGALLASAVGAVVTVAILIGRRRRLVAWLAAVAAASVAGAFLQSLPQAATSAAPPPAPAAPSAPAPIPRYQNVESRYPLDNDVGRPLPGGGEPPVTRSFFGTSGRTAAWKGALGQVAGRPLLGYGFGTEARTFVDRYYGFFGGVPENSYIGVTLQLGAVGLAALLALVALVVVSGRRALRAPARAAAAGCTGAVAAGLAAACVQSYLYAVGNIAAAPFWICLFLLPAVAAARSGA